MRVGTGLTELADGAMNVFSFHGFSYIVADSLLRTNADTLLGHFFVDHPLAGWPLFIGTMYLEGASVFIAFRPRLHRFWGFGLIAFHVGTQLTMNITFPENTLLLAVLLVCSPFAPDHVAIIDTATDSVVAFLPTPAGTHGAHWGAKRGGGYYLYVTNQFSNALTVIDPDPNRDGGGADAAVVGRVVLANGSEGAGVTDGTGGQGLKPLPNVYRGWIEDTVALSGTGRLSAEVEGWISALTPAQRHP